MFRIEKYVGEYETDRLTEYLSNVERLYLIAVEIANASYDYEINKQDTMREWVEGIFEWVQSGTMPIATDTEKQLVFSVGSLHRVDWAEVVDMFED
jgi:hypothetical protein